MKVVFFEDVEGTARVGEVKDVKNGFARNFLLPRGLAGPSSRENVFRAQALAVKEAKRQEKLDMEASSVAERLRGYTLSIEARVGDSGRLFGSVTNRDIASRLHAAAGIDIDAHIVLLPEPIRDLGPHAVTVRFTSNVSAQVTVDVVPDAESRPIVERLRAEAEARAAEEARRAAESEYAQRQARGRGAQPAIATPDAAEGGDADGDTASEGE